MGIGRSIRTGLVSLVTLGGAMLPATAPSQAESMNAAPPSSPASAAKHTAARMKSEEMFRRVNERSNSAIRSICYGCMGRSDTQKGFSPN